MMILPEFELARPKTLEEALTLARDSKGNFDYLAGGTDLLPNYKCGINTHRQVIALRNIAELHELSGGSVGSCVTLADLERDADFLADYPVFAGTLQHLASPLLRQSGTVGGNICLDTRCIFLNQTEFARTALGYCLKANGPECRVVPGSTDKCYANYSGDMAPVFMVLGADVRLAGPDGERRVALKDFFQLDGIARFLKTREEILVSVELPAEAKELSASYQKLRVRDAWDFPEVAVAVAARLDGDKIADLRIVANAVASIPLWLEDVAAGFIGRTVDDDTIEEIAEATAKATKPVKATLLPPGYRRQMVTVMTRRALKVIRGAASAPAPAPVPAGVA